MDISIKNPSPASGFRLVRKRGGSSVNGRWRHDDAERRFSMDVDVHWADWLPNSWLHPRKFIYLFIHFYLPPSRSFYIFFAGNASNDNGLRRRPVTPKRQKVRHLSS